MLLQFVKLYNSNHLSNDTFNQIRNKLTTCIGKKLIWSSKHEIGSNRDIEVVIERLSNRFATVFRTLDNGRKIRYTINYHNLICGDDEIYIKQNKNQLS